MDVQAKALTIAALGDSLTAGFGLPGGQSFTAVLEKELRARGRDVAVVNFGVSGDTTAGGVSRVKSVLASSPDGVILELGANDGLRGLDPAQAEANLDRIIAACKERGVPVLLMGMRTLSGMGKRYGEEFAAIYPRLAQKYGLTLYPFFLEGVAGDPALNLPDGLHPNHEGIREIVRGTLPTVEKWLDTIGK
ncbi:arylesterase [Fundidesulfovibrio agrisoli]|uniref:arylesterase n=1 Tax=Fundidesulfovibrio agrisoli TaxID=2922717 RepID=UPI001FAC6B7E|nr:arylesterase [Fundidesulfovibrio agrisoli]